MRGHLHPLLPGMSAVLAMKNTVRGRGAGTAKRTWECHIPWEYNPIRTPISDVVPVQFRGGSYGDFNFVFLVVHEPVGASRLLCRTEGFETMLIHGFHSPGKRPARFVVGKEGLRRRNPIKHKVNDGTFWMNFASSDCETRSKPSTFSWLT